MRKHILTLVGALALAVSVTPAMAADFSDPDWPCVQRKVPHLSVGQMWAGPPIGEADLSAWRKDDRVAGLAPVLAVRRTAEEQADSLIGEFSETHAEDRNRALSLLFAGAFTLIERERSEIISGIGRYARTQTALAAGIDALQTELAELQALAEPNFDQQDRMEELEDKVHWDTRIYKDRQQSLTYVCETPVILEKRAFALARMIQGRLD